MKKTFRFTLWIIVALVVLFIVQVVRAGRSLPESPEISYSDFLARVASGQVSKVIITCNLVRGFDAKGGGFLLTAPPNQTAMLELLQQRGVEIWFRDAPTWPTWALYLIPMLFLVVLFFVVMSQRRRIKLLESANGITSGARSSPA